MTSDDWTKVLLALIAMLGTVAASYLEILRRKANMNDVKTDMATKAATETREIVNGRLDQLLKLSGEKSFAEGHAAGILVGHAAGIVAAKESAEKA